MTKPSPERLFVVALLSGVSLAFLAIGTAESRRSLVPAPAPIQVPNYRRTLSPNFNRKAFFDEVRDTVFQGSLSQTQVDGLNFLLDVWQQHYASLPDTFLAYALGTVKTETSSFLPTDEGGGDAYLFRMYDPCGPNRANAIEHGNKTCGDGVKYRGRGYVQLTWKNNYREMSRVVGVDLVSNPELAKVPDYAAKILFTGMTQGLFTGVGLPKYLNASGSDWYNARRVVNGTDRAGIIARDAQAFHRAIRRAGAETLV